MSVPFRIDILDVNGNIVGDGPLNNVITVEDTRRLDAIGQLTFTMPARDERGQYINAGVSFNVYDSIDGYLGRFYFESRSIDARAEGGAQLVINAYDQLVELARQSVHFRLTFNNESVDSVVDDLVTEVSGWTTVVDAGIGNTSIMYEGESVLRAVDVLRSRWNQHYRLGDDRELEFGAFGNTLDIVLRNLPGQIQFSINDNVNVAIVDVLRVLDEADEIFNKVIPLGAGQGVTQLTIENATLGSYTVQEGLNNDGSSYWYIENSASVSNYGRRERVLSLPQIRPITNSDANITNAANALKLSAEAYIARHLIPHVTYQVTLRALRQDLRVGDIVRLQYRDVIDNYGFVDIDDSFYILDVTRRRHVNGQRSAQIVISSIAAQRTTDTDIMIDVINDLRALKINIPITLAYSPVGPYIQRIDPTHSTAFTIRIGAEVTFLNYAIIRFKTAPLKSSVSAVAAAGSTSVSSGASSASTTSSKNHTHSITASGSHTHTLNVSDSGGHVHTISITSTGIGSSDAGGSSSPTTEDGSNHNHVIPITSSGAPSGDAVHISGGGALNAVSGVDGSTDIESAPHTHVVNISTHQHGIDHGHSGSTASSTTHTHTGQTTDSQTHDHDIAASGNHDHDMPHTHSVDVAGHNHDLSYGIFEDLLYPKSIGIVIDGIDRTTALGGSWAPTGEPVEIEIDVTEYLVEAAGGLRQNHSVVFECLDQQGEIEFECDMLLSIQAIAVS